MLEHLFTDVCTILRRHQKQKLSYASGSSVFHIGAKVTGSTSGATATIDKISGTVSTGYIVLRNVSGTFQASELIKDNGTPQGSATTDGVAIGYLNGSNEPEYSGFVDDQVNVPCQFYSMSTRMSVISSGEYSDQQPAVHLGPDVTIDDFDYRIKSTVIGFEGTYQIIGPIKPSRKPWVTDEIDHYECQLKEVAGL
jgi:hypothetical protein